MTEYQKGFKRAIIELEKEALILDKDGMFKVLNGDAEAGMEKVMKASSYNEACEYLKGIKL